MEANLFLDVQIIQDGSARWLWQLRAQTALYGAGVAMSRADAERAGEQAMTDLGAREHARKLARPEPTKGEPALNLDELERGAGEEGE